MLQTTILENLTRLPESLQQEVLHFIEFLLARYVKPSPLGSTQLPSQPSAQPSKRGGLGAWKGKIKMSDDFDEPLEDFQDYM